jgi:hypothetical protein
VPQIYPGSKGSLQGEINEVKPVWEINKLIIAFIAITSLQHSYYSNVVFPNRFDIFLQMANHMRDSNSEPNQVWKWDLQPM